MKRQHVCWLEVAVLITLGCYPWHPALDSTSFAACAPRVFRTGVCWWCVLAVSPSCRISSHCPVCRTSSIDTSLGGVYRKWDPTLGGCRVCSWTAQGPSCSHYTCRVKPGGRDRGSKHLRLVLIVVLFLVYAQLFGGSLHKGCWSLQPTLRAPPSRTTKVA